MIKFDLLDLTLIGQHSLALKFYNLSAVSFLQIHIFDVFFITTKIFRQFYYEKSSLANERQLSAFQAVITVHVCS